MGANWAFQLYQDREAFERARSAIRQRLDAAAPLAPFEVEVDEGAARRTLRTQIARLERELASLFATARPGDDLDWRVGTPGGPRVLDIGDLEALRDDLATRVEEIRRAQRERAEGYAGGKPRRRSRRWSRIPPSTSGGASPTRTSARTVASTITRRRGSASSGC